MSQIAREPCLCFHDFPSECKNVATYQWPLEPLQQSAQLPTQRSTKPADWLSAIRQQPSAQQQSRNKDWRPDTQEGKDVNEARGGGSTESTNTDVQKDIASQRKKCFYLEIFGQGWIFFFFKINKDTGFKLSLKEPNSYEQT